MSQELITAYRSSNLVLTDKVEYLTLELDEMKIEMEKMIAEHTEKIEAVKELLKKSIQEKLYWKEKHDKKSAFIHWGD